MMRGNISSEVEARQGRIYYLEESWIRLSFKILKFDISLLWILSYLRDLLNYWTIHSIPSTFTLASVMCYPMLRTILACAHNL